VQTVDVHERCHMHQVVMQETYFAHSTIVASTMFASILLGFFFLHGKVFDRTFNPIHGLIIIGRVWNCVYHIGAFHVDDDPNTGSV